MNTSMGRMQAGLLAFLLAVSCCVAALAQDVARYYHTDLTGSPLAATDAGGNVLWREDFSPYGERLLRQGGAAANRMWFTGHHHDNDSGLTYAGARHYDPLIGRFLGVDPLGVEPANPFSFNQYAYANDNPHRFIDPDGRSPLDVAFLAYDLGRLTVALYTGAGVAAAVMDVAWSTVGVFSPIPGTGQAIKTVQAVERGLEVARAVDHAGDAARGALKVEQVARGGASAANVANKVNHIFREGKNLEGLVRASGGSAEAAYGAVQSAANEALRKGLLNPAANGVSPGAGAGAVLNVNGVNVQLIGGRVIDGVVQIGSFVGL